MDTLTKVVLWSVLGVMFVCLIALLYMLLCNLKDFVRLRRIKKNEVESEDEHLTDKTVSQSTESEEIKKRLEYLEFKDKNPSGVEIVRNVKRDYGVISCKYSVEYVFDDCLHSAFLFGLDPAIVKFPKCEVCSNTESSLIIKADETYYKVEKATENVMDVTELIKKQKRKN